MFRKGGDVGGGIMNNVVERGQYAESNAKDFATIPQNDDTAELTRYRCGVNGICQPDENGPFISLQQCQQSGCGPDRERDPELEPVTPYVGATGRPSPGGPLEEIVKKISKKLKNKK